MDQPTSIAAVTTAAPESTQAPTPTVEASQPPATEGSVPTEVVPTQAPPTQEPPPGGGALALRDAAALPCAPGEMPLVAGKKKDAADAFRKALKRYPNRKLSNEGLKIASAP